MKWSNCQTEGCESEYGTEHEIHLSRIKADGSKVKFDAKYVSCDGCSASWEKHIVGLTGKLPDGTWKKG